MRSKETIEKKLADEEKLAEDLLRQAMEASGTELHEVRIRQRNKVIERIYTLKWVLNLINEL